MSNAKRFALLGGLLIAPAAWGQIFTWKWMQPWTPPWASHQSLVASCAQPTPLPVGGLPGRIAMDDWLCGQSGPIIRYCWWGALNNPAQRFRPYYIAVRRTSAVACQPDMTAAGLLYQTCIVPDYAAYVGTDCQQRRVYRMSGVIPTGSVPFVQTVNQRYWLQVSEADAESIQPNVENFRWSAHRPIVNCNAVQYQPLPAPPILITPLRDPCDQIEDDLSFCLARKDISGTLNPPTGLAIPVILHLNLMDTSGMLREKLCLEPDDMGNFYVVPESPDGTYMVEVEGAGLLHMRRTVQIQDGTCARLSFFDIFYGDLNNDHQVDINDLAMELANFGRMMP